MITKTKSSPFLKVMMVAVLGWTLLVTLARAIRYPNDFAEAFWLFDYRFGLIKRGFMGSGVSLLERVGGVPLTETTIRVLSFLFLGIFCVALLAVMRRVLVKTEWTLDAFLAMALFATSPFIVMSAHLTGYFDNLFLLCTLVSVGLILRDHLWAAACVAAIAMLIHESFLLVGFPLLCLATFVQRKRAAPLLLPLLVFGALLVSERWLNQPVLKMLLTLRLEEYPFVRDRMSTLIPVWHTAGGLALLKAQSPYFLGRVFSFHTLVVVPSVVALLSFTAWNLGRDFKTGRFALLTFIAFMPFLLHAVAWDTARIATYAVISAFVGLWIFAETTPLYSATSWSVPLRLLALGCLGWNFFPQLRLMDNRVEQLAMPIRLALYAPLMVAVGILWLREAGIKRATGRPFPP